MKSDELYDKKICKNIVHAMSITKEDVIDDYHAAVSESNENGINGSVWGRRSDVLVKDFSDFLGLVVLHIKRSALWQIDPVLDTNTGVLYLLFSKTNLKVIRKKYFLKGTSTHYSYSLLLFNMGLLPKFASEGELIQFSEEELEIQMSKRQQDIIKLLGENAENVKKIVMISVDYLGQEAVSATRLEYTSDFEISSEVDISGLIESSYLGDGLLNDPETVVAKEEKPLVKLKNSQIAE